MARVRTGADCLARDEFALLKGKRVGLVCNQTTVLSAGLGHLADALAAAPGVDLVALFGPEHGIRGAAQDMVGVDAGHDGGTGLRVHSLYGADFDSLKPTPADLEGLDLLIFDVQDVGSRYYTYAATMSLCMQACAKLSLPVMVLDRPNPLGGVEVEGGHIEPGYQSFVGLHSIPVRHGCTVGELARYHNETQKIGVELEVVAMEGWSREMYFDDTGLVFIGPSPNMPTADTAFVYPGMCLVEGSELSEGRGTTWPFELAGAPFIDGPRLREKLEASFAYYEVGAVTPRACMFQPMFQKHAGTGCGGVFLHVQDRASVKPYRLGLVFLEAVHALWPDEFEWRTRTYEFVDDPPAIDLLTGSSAFRAAVDAGDDLCDVIAAHDGAAVGFASARTPFLLY